MDAPEISNLRPLRILAFSVVLGIAAGLPLIYRKNGLGILVVSFVTVVTVFVLSAIFNAKTSPNTESKEVRKRGFLLPISSVFIGPTIAVGGGYIAHLVSPEHPMDVLPMLYSLAVLGVFAGAVVGIGMWIAFRFSRG